ncbi:MULTISPECIES: helix-turn-helix domain-containing protein [Niastella]|uniref:Helix-turn-helix domain-containing protein n=1 Tax=Niastella soli TaxID=2821487 RepID=A0ABS3YVS3_9BACT|nr:helix-turn-helix domain-containing protein [Niastella soli]MBO9202039.1 helix-turn-helix domain-containing protein [Niastella soli]
MNNVHSLYPSGIRPVNRDQLVTLADLEAFKTSLLVTIRQILTENKGQTTKWLKSYQVKKLLGVSTGTLQNLRNNGTLPYSKIGGTIYYSSDEINKLLQEKDNFHRTISMDSRQAK